MDAVEFLNEWKRMCQSDINCNECIIKKICVYNSGSAPDSIVKSKELVELVEKWSKEHPIKTRANDFWEKHPNAKVDCDFYTEFCCETLGYCEKCKHGYDTYACKDCWNEPV